MTNRVKLFVRHYTSLELQDTSGTVLQNMRTANSYQFNVTPDQTYNFRVKASTEVTFEMHLKSGWNFISLPLQPSTTDPSTLFPEVVQFYEWDPNSKSYSVPTQLVHGKGYWACVFTDVTKIVSGISVNQLHLEGVAGWHMIGSLPIEGIVDVISGTVWEQFYGWDAQAKSYQLVSTLEPGGGYWFCAFTPFSIDILPKP